MVRLKQVLRTYELKLLKLFFSSRGQDFEQVGRLLIKRQYYSSSTLNQNVTLCPKSNLRKGCNTLKLCQLYYHRKIIQVRTEIHKNRLLLVFVTLLDFTAQCALCIVSKNWPCVHSVELFRLLLQEEALHISRGKKAKKLRKQQSWDYYYQYTLVPFGILLMGMNRKKLYVFGLILKKLGTGCPGKFWIVY